MKTRLMLCALPLLFTAACTAPADPEETADAGSPYLAKEVVGIHMLSADRNYDKLAEALPEEFVRNTFKVSEEMDMMVHDQPEGVMYHWGKNHVVVKMGSERPFASIYKAEAVFDHMIQTSKPEMKETVAAVDSLDVVAEPAEASASETIVGLGDKAVWTPATETLHVLFNNHILNLTVETADNEATKKQRAVLMAEVLLANLTGVPAGPSEK